METVPKHEVKKFVLNITDQEAEILKLMFTELKKADAKYAHDRMSRIELKASLATLKCEVHELARETKRKKKNWDCMKKEAIQVLAMSFKFNRDVIYGTE